MFPSPIGVLYILIKPQADRGNKMKKSFPSPIGVLYILIDLYNFVAELKDFVSVPYRGSLYSN